MRMLIREAGIELRLQSIVAGRVLPGAATHYLNERLG